MWPEWPEFRAECWGPKVQGSGLSLWHRRLCSLLREKLRSTSVPLQVSTWWRARVWLPDMSSYAVGEKHGKINWLVKALPKKIRALAGIEVISAWNCPSYFWSNHCFVRKTIHFITRNSTFLIFWVAMCFIFSSGWYPRHGLSEIWQEPSGTSFVCASKSQGFHRNNIPYNGPLKSIDFFSTPKRSYGVIHWQKIPPSYAFSNQIGLGYIYIL